MIMKEIILEDAKKYMIGHIVYLDKKPYNFVVVFFNTENSMLPAVRTVVKRDKSCSPVLRLSAKTTSVEPKIPISSQGEAEFKGRAMKIVSSLCCVSAGEENG